MYSTISGRLHIYETVYKIPGEYPLFIKYLEHPWVKHDNPERVFIIHVPVNTLVFSEVQYFIRDRESEEYIQYP